MLAVVNVLSTDVAALPFNRKQKRQISEGQLCLWVTGFSAMRIAVLVFAVAIAAAVGAAAVSTLHSR